MQCAPSRKFVHADCFLVCGRTVRFGKKSSSAQFEKTYEVLSSRGCLKDPVSPSVSLAVDSSSCCECAKPARRLLHILTPALCQNGSCVPNRGREDSCEGSYEITQLFETFGRVRNTFEGREAISTTRQHKRWIL